MPDPLCRYLSEGAILPRNAGNVMPIAKYFVFSKFFKQFRQIQMTPRSQSGHIHSAINVQGFTGDVTALVRGKKSDNVRNLLWSAQPAQRHLP